MRQFLKFRIAPCALAMTALVLSSVHSAPAQAESSKPRYVVIHCIEAQALKDPEILSAFGKFVTGTDPEPSHASDKYSSIVIKPDALSRTGLVAEIRIKNLVNTRMQRTADVQVIVEGDRTEFKFTDWGLRELGSGLGLSHSDSEIGTTLVADFEFPKLNSGKVELECLVVKPAK